MSIAHFPLAKVGELRVPPRALKHMHIKEARAIATMFSDDRVERIIGTRNKGAPGAQVYGWGPNVPKHADETGWIYFAPLMMGRSHVNAGHVRLELEPFAVYRLNDHAIHWTEDTAPVVCLFAGVFPEPDDGGALARARHWLIATCALCKDFAIKVDGHFPYHWENNRCAKHTSEAAS